MEFYNSITGQKMEPADWQRNLDIGDHYMNNAARGWVGDHPFDGPTIYGRIESSDGCEPGFFWVRGYSQWCPDGELGLFNICEATHPLTPDEFEQARQAGWPDKRTQEERPQ